MNLAARIYKKLHWHITHHEEKGERSAGYWMRKVRQEAVLMIPATTGRLLDLGCGEGLFLRELSVRNRDTKIFGVDKSLIQLNRAREKLAAQGIERVHLSLADAVQLPFAADYFDLVVTLNFIYNMPGKEVVKNIFREIARVTKRKGRLIVDFRNASNPFLVLKYKLAPRYDPSVKDIPLNPYTIEEISSWLEQAGFKIVKTLQIGFPLKALAPVIIVEAEKV